MEDYLRGIKQIADSLASIGSPVSDMDLVTQTLNGVHEDYHILATTLSYGSTFLTFDDFQAKLFHYKQCLKFLQVQRWHWFSASSLSRFACLILILDQLQLFDKFFFEPVQHWWPKQWWRVRPSPQ